MFSSVTKVYIFKVENLNHQHVYLFPCTWVSCWAIQAFSFSEKVIGFMVRQSFLLNPTPTFPPRLFILKTSLMELLYHCFF